MRLSRILLACAGIAQGYDMDKWIRAADAEGGYTRASCDCEIECTPESISETCGADVVVGVDMQSFSNDKKALVSDFIGHLHNELDVGLKFDQTLRNSARLSVFGFSDKSQDLRQPLSFDMFADASADDIKHITENAFNEGSDVPNAIDIWYFLGHDSDLPYGLEHAHESMAVARDQNILDELDSLGFHHTRLIVLLTDGTANDQTAALKNIKNEIHGDNIKIVVVTLSEIDSPHCQDGQGSSISTCPNMEFLASIGDIVIDGKDEAHAARQVMEKINGQKCRFDGGCKPCNCECSFPRGPAGLMGEPGCEGIAGPCGNNGECGADGMDGIKGPDGDEGAKGECGPCGIPGLPGSAGEPGPDGVPSIDGHDGVPGDQGPVGTDGLIGDPGVLGFSGVHGPGGFQGTRGDQGLKGTKGEPGIEGDVILNVTGGPKLLKNARTRRAIKRPAIPAESIVEISNRFRREGSLGDAINEANQELLDLEKSRVDNSKPDSSDPSADAAFYAQFAENEAKWNQYLTDYYDTSTLETLSMSIRGVIQEWMQNNIDVINCILNCNDCGDDGEVRAGHDKDVLMIPLKCEEPVDVVFMVDGSDSVSARDWPMVLKWTNNLIDQISPQDREYSSSAVFQQFSRDPVTGEIPDAIIGQFGPDDAGSVKDFKDQVINTIQSAQGTNTYESLNKVFSEPDGLYYTLPTFTGVQPDGETIDGATVFITLSDGESRDRATQRDQAVVDKLKKLSRMQIAVGVGKSYNKAELYDFAQDDDHILTYDDFDQLVEAGQQIVNLIQEGCKSNEMRDVNNIIEPELETGNEYESESMDQSSYPSMELNEYDSSNESDAANGGDMEDIDRSMDSSMPWENTNMESEEPRSQDLDLDFLDWTYYNRHDKRHRHRK